MTDLTSRVVDPRFEVYAAIDVLGGQCVRLRQGDYDAATQYSSEPWRMAERWLDAGARFLHVVDLDAAKSGQPENADALREILRVAVSAGASVQVGGGIRSLETLDHWLDLGVTRCVVGTAAMDLAWVESAVRRFGPQRLVVGLDGRDGMLAVHGWTEQTKVSLVDKARELAGVGVRYALVTDVARDGMLEGPNLELASAVQSAGLAAIASGGLRDADDVMAAREVGLYGVIAGRSLYDGTLDLGAVIAELRSPRTGKENDPC